MRGKTIELSDCRANPSGVTPKVGLTGDMNKVLSLCLLKKKSSVVRTCWRSFKETAQLQHSLEVTGLGKSLRGRANLPGFILNLEAAASCVTGKKGRLRQTIHPGKSLETCDLILIRNIIP